jgi:hypothetical protein
MEKKLKPCPFCGGEVEFHEDDMGGAWVEHKIKHKNGQKDKCILTSVGVNFSEEYEMDWNTRAANANE